MYDAFEILTIVVLEKWIHVVDGIHLKETLGYLSRGSNDVTPSRNWVKLVI